MNIKQTIVLRKAWTKEDLCHKAVLFHGHPIERGFIEKLQGLGFTFDLGYNRLNEVSDLWFNDIGMMNFTINDFIKRIEIETVNYEDIVFEDETANIGDACEFKRDDGSDWFSGILSGYSKYKNGKEYFWSQIGEGASTGNKYARKLRVPEKKYVPLDASDIIIGKSTLRLGNYEYVILSKNKEEIMINSKNDPIISYSFLVGSNAEISHDYGKTWNACHKEVSNG